MPHELRNGRHAGPEQRYGQRLRLIEYNHAPRNVVQLTAARSFGRIHGFEELHRCGHDDRRIPVFTGKPAAPALKAVRIPCIIAELNLAVMLQHVFIAKYLRKNARRLLNDAGVWNNIDNPHQPARHSMAERKGQRSHRLSAAGRHSERVKPAGLFTAAQALRKHRISAAAQLVARILQPRRDMRSQLIQQRRKRLIASARLRTLKRRLRIQKICVDQTGKQHARVHRRLDRFELPADPIRYIRLRFHLNFAPPCRRIHIPRQLLLHPAHQRFLIRQAAMVSRNGKGRRNIPQAARRQLRARRRMIHRMGMLRIALTPLPCG